MKTIKLITLSSIVLSMQAAAAGFALNEHSASSAGVAYAGRGSNAEDASIIASNPAGIALLENTEITLGSAYVVPKGEFTGTSSFGGASESDNFLTNAAIPFGYFATPVNDKLTLGFGIYAPFGTTVEYDDDWGGRYHSIKTEMTTISLQPTVAYRINDQWAVGLGIAASYAEGVLSQNIYTGDAVSSLKGDSWAANWTVGTVWQPNDKTTFGLSYRSKTSHTLKGDTTVTGATPTTIEEKTKLNLTLPENLELSVTYKLDDRWTVIAGATYTRWSSFDELIAESDQSDGPISGGGLLPSGTPSTPSCCNRYEFRI